MSFMEYQVLVYGITSGIPHSRQFTTLLLRQLSKVLLELGVLKKEIPITEKPGKKTIYGIGDNFFRFWYRFVPQNASAIHAGRLDRIYELAIKKYFSEYMGLVFKQICREYLIRYDENLPFLLSDVGQWWGTDPKLKKEVQIDIVGTPVEGVDELELLKRYAAVFNCGTKYHYYIFSKGGFTQGLRNLEEKGEVRLFTLDDIY